MHKYPFAVDSYFQKNKLRFHWDEKNFLNLGAWRKVFVILWVLCPRPALLGSDGLEWQSYQPPHVGTHSLASLSGLLHSLASRNNQWMFFKSVHVSHLLMSHWRKWITWPNSSGQTFSTLSGKSTESYWARMCISNETHSWMFFPVCHHKSNCILAYWKHLIKQDVYWNRKKRT